MKAIDDALEGSRHFILFGTKIENIQSSWVEAEWRLFINEKRSGRKAKKFLTAVGGDLSPSGSAAIITILRSDSCRGKLH